MAAAAAICAVVAAPAGAGAAAAGARWTPPVEISAPNSIEVVGSQVAASTAGATAVSFNEVNFDVQSTAAAFLALASPGRSFAPARVVGQVQEVLALAYSGSTLELMTAKSPAGQPCCTTVQVLRRGPHGKFSRPQTLVASVGGGAIGRLVALANGRLLAVVAGPQRLWVTEARGSGRFAKAKGLTRLGVAPNALAVTATPGGGSAVVWTQGSSQSVIGATGAPGAAPSKPRTLVRVAAGHVVDGLQVAPLAAGSTAARAARAPAAGAAGSTAAGAAGLTIGWTESWNDGSGAYHSQAVAADLPGPGKPAHPRALSAPRAVASGLALAADGSGDQVAAWDDCAAELCTVHGAVRKRDGRWFGASSRLGSIDDGDSPQVIMAPDREALTGWITGTQAVLAELRPGSSHFAAARRLSGMLAGSLDVGFGPSGEAVATWTQGTLNQDVFASVLR